MRDTNVQRISDYEKVAFERGVVVGVVATLVLEALLAIILRFAGVLDG